MTAYGWPVRPFNRAHPVRGYFNDPRISGTSRAFHFGIDISARDGTAVFAVEGGTVHRERGRSLAVVSPGGARTFGYWHLVPAVKHRQQVRRHQLLGHIEAGWGHVHFAESSRRQYRNPLRPGGLGPWTDPTSPRIAGIAFSRDGKALSPLSVNGTVDVIVDAFDKPPLRVPPPWDDMPVTPAILRWRVLRGRKVVRPWHAPIDFRKVLLPASLFQVVYAPGTRQNKPNKPGRYLFFVAHSWNTRRLPNGLYRLEVSAADVNGNRAVAALPFTIANRR
jgi:murein DD-endopeptidase MepM/ murein hydrolase activator NlpD